MEKEEIYSRIQKDKLLHIVYRINNDNSERINLISNENFIQCSFLNLKEGTTFKPHKHIIKSRFYANKIAQESWVVIKGKVKCIFYDLDDQIIATPILNAGDVSFTLFGGHNYEILEDNTIVYEYKTGPYEGQINDKEFI